MEQEELQVKFGSNVYFSWIRPRNAINAIKNLNENGHNIRDAADFI